LETSGFKLLVTSEERRLATVTTILVPDDLKEDWKKIIQEIMKKYAQIIAKLLIKDTIPKA